MSIGELVSVKTERSKLLDLFKPLFIAMGIDTYGLHYDNAVFEMHPYCWCDEKSCPMCVGHVVENGQQTRTTFFHKPSGFRLHWYKYAMHSVDVNQQLEEEQLVAIVADCIKSLEPDLLTFEERLAIAAERVKVLLKPAREALLIRASSDYCSLFVQEVEAMTDEQCAITWAAEQRRMVDEFDTVRLRSQIGK